MLAAATRRLESAAVPDPRVDAELLLADLLSTGRGSLMLARARIADADLVRSYRERVDLRAQRMPLQHITGTQQFHGLDFRVDGRALIPRPETEGLVDAVLGLDLPAGSRVVDLGTGSGCIAVTLAAKGSGLALFAVDAADGALSLARENAQAHGVAGRIEFLHADLGETQAGWRGTMRAIACNPPYVGEGEWSGLEPEVRDHDPRQALVAGPTGLEVYARVAVAAADLLAPAGVLVLELGYGQERAVAALLGKAGLSVIEVRPDLNRIPRILLAERPGEERR